MYKWLNLGFGNFKSTFQIMHFLLVATIFGVLCELIFAF